MEKIIGLKVIGLFGRFNHTIEFHEDNDLVIITAPNGYGKTMMLRIIDSLFSYSFDFFRQLMFTKIVISFNSGKEIAIEKSSNDLFEREGIKMPKSITFHALNFEEDCPPFELHDKYDESLMRLIESHSPVSRVEPDSWFDHSTDEIISNYQVVERYGRNHSKFVKGKHPLIPSWLDEICNSLRVHLVETQRLLSFEGFTQNPRSYSNRRRVEKPLSVVEKDAQDLSQKISNFVQTYALESQQLDQSFPKRFIESRADSIIDESVVRERLSELNTKQANLREAGLIGKAISEPVDPTEKFEDELVRRVLSIYIEDTAKKLSIFDDIYDRINLFKEILDDHFSFKKVVINQENGIEIIDSETTDIIGLVELSSGEQHELVLIYELIFKVEEGALILIDEPELSLHVAWQKKFIANLQKIQALRKLDVVIATHSPQIINNDWDLVQDLELN